MNIIWRLVFSEVALCSVRLEIRVLHSLIVCFTVLFVLIGNLC